MVVELNLLISLLKLTKNDSALIEDVKIEARLPSNVMEKLLQKLQRQDLVYLKDDAVKVNACGRLSLAVMAVSLGGDVERVSSLLCWQEFEEMAAAALRSNGYTVTRNLRFTFAGRRWEIDVVGCMKPLVVCIDCKHYHHGVPPSVMKRIVESQTQRVRALSDMLPSVKIKLDCVCWGKAKFVPAVLSLLPVRSKFFEGVPVVPVLQLQDFLSHLPLEVNSLTYFSKAFSHLRQDF
jgi:Holliday junction resolvase-like predicted endonuclease